MTRLAGLVSVERMCKGVNVILVRMGLDSWMRTIHLAALQVNTVDKNIYCICYIVGTVNDH